MVKRLTKYTALVAVLLMLAPFSFCFYYCELAECANGRESSSPLDFCTIIKVANLETSRVVAADLCRLKVVKYFTPHFCPDLSIQRISTSVRNIALFHPPKISTPIFLYNNTLLI